MTIKAFIVGTGGHAQMLYQLLNSASDQSIEIHAWLEAENYQGADTLFDIPVLRQTSSGLDFLKANNIQNFYFGIGMIKTAPWRMAIYQELSAQGFIAQSFIHPSAIVDSSSSIAAGTIVAAGCIVQPFAQVGENCLLNTGSIVEHHSEIGDNVHLAPGAILCGQAGVGANTIIGAGSVVLQEVSIGENATVGAGSIVTRNVADNSIVIGQPARVKDVSKEMSHEC